MPDNLAISTWLKETFDASCEVEPEVCNLDYMTLITDRQTGVRVVCFCGPSKIAMLHTAGTGLEYVWGGREPKLYTKLRRDDPDFWNKLAGHVRALLADVEGYRRIQAAESEELEKEWEQEQKARQDWEAMPAEVRRQKQEEYLAKLKEIVAQTGMAVATPAIPEQIEWAKDWLEEAFGESCDIVRAVFGHPGLATVIDRQTGVSVTCGFCDSLAVLIHTGDPDVEQARRNVVSFAEFHFRDKLVAAVRNLLVDVDGWRKIAERRKGTGTHT